jgi:hypothetical protein
MIAILSKACKNTTPGIRNAEKKLKGTVVNNAK